MSCGGSGAAFMCDILADSFFLWKMLLEIVSRCALCPLKQLLHKVVPRFMYIKKCQNHPFQRKSVVAVRCSAHGVPHIHSASTVYYCIAV